MVLTYQEALNRFGSRYRIRKAVSEGEIRSIGRGLYSTSEDEYPLVAIAKRHPNGILTGQTTLYAHGLVTAPPRESIRPRNAEKPKYTTSPYVSISSLKSGWKSDERPYQWAESISPLTISSACSLNL